MGSAKYTWKSKVQRSTALQPTLANSVVSNLLEVEMGGMAIFYLHFKTESIFDSSPPLKGLSTTFRKDTHFTPPLEGKKNKPQTKQETSKSSKQSSSKSSNKSTSCTPAQSNILVQHPLLPYSFQFLCFHNFCLPRTRAGCCTTLKVILAPCLRSFAFGMM